MLEKSLVYPIDKKMDSAAIIVSVVEAFCKKVGTAKKDALRLHLLTEEVLGLLNAIVYVEDGKFFIEKEGNEYRIQVSAVADIDSEKKQALVESSSDGKNGSYQGVSGKIFSVVDSLFTKEGYGAMALAAIDRQMYGNTLPVWSLAQYYEETKENKEEWDGLERSILLKIADDVLVSTRGESVQITVVKSFIKKN
ncbi:MAG: hypothetical protein R3Y58_12150 [Eubacteriales bacterium]